MATAVGYPHGLVAPTPPRSPLHATAVILPLAPVRLPPASWLGFPIATLADVPPLPSPTLVVPFLPRINVVMSALLGLCASCTACEWRRERCLL